MIGQILGALPIGVFGPLRLAAARWPRGNPLRKGAVAVLQQSLRGYRGRLASKLTEVRPLDEPDLSFEPTDSMVIDSVFWFGVRGYEGILSDVWTSLCKRSAGVLEIGGNIGFFTVLGGRRTSAPYTVVEPLPENADVLRKNLARNAITHCRVLEAAAIPSATAATIEINIPDEGRDAPVGAHLVIGSEVSGRSSARTISVEGLPFRDLIAGCDLIKIDAEGIEAELIESAYAELVARRPTLVVEVLPESHHLAALLAALAREAGYIISVIPAYGGHAITEIAPDLFTAGTPTQYNSKDVVLSVASISI